MALAWATTAASAEDPMSEFAAASTLSVAALIEKPLPPRFCLSRSVAAPILASFERVLNQTLPGHRAMRARPAWDIDHSDGALDRLLQSRHVELLTLMQTESTSLFFGVNAKGRVGVHFDGTSLLAPR
jgi:hypothetical protein